MALAKGVCSTGLVLGIETVELLLQSILVSVGYGPTIPGGRLTSMTFGPVNAEGGERRLNVLFTRARIRCEIFASFDPVDIDVRDR
ncbi:hypothetical protein [Novosphingobium sp.]|uniref:hypothetical protein n=1 Tax=Novosphingobium sp. TaxID=1874826 RepID=UPI00286DC8AC|nr:hypothetical protein [Novosphingobium sp.]